MAIESLLLAYGLVAIALFISYHHKLGLEKEVAVASLRAAAQLAVMGFLLEAILTIDNKLILALILLAMTGIAAAISGKRGKQIPMAGGIAFAGILAGSVITFGVLAGAGVIGPEARFIIPLGGMVIGNSMNAASLSMNRLIGEMGHQRARIETLLSLGANARQASEWAVRQSVRSALIPVIDSMKIIGLVHLPGIMTGFIIAGGSPLEAVKYQLAIVFMIAGTASLTCIIVTLLAARRCFSRELQLLDTFRPA
ncbi:MAG: iron export ABC transporter permease subunit FetB [Nitrospinaceae bacterium]|nr:iron export ABC transporter permease subunit FetB [Nitrospinaceae bacterium]NIR56211.1 iron export ABC transporter permease subunit FetB [Nitrospinaceae bacterium]NIS86667.1 iron export ABC transporter permease subunit FetB [Nitrospinaceae bacterium]NIT83500.1 iron export ABC transporter permease subunit FetB [Nitrospinaceae bacterium]NIU45705.1 iron export ABC transporter permease subunit FetB [Nitrospinaceae bacterium]